MAWLRRLFARWPRCPHAFGTAFVAYPCTKKKWHVGPHRNVAWDVWWKGGS